MSDSCDPMNCSLPGSSIHGILQARIPEWVAISFSSGTSQPRNWTQVSCIAGRCLTDWATWEASKLVKVAQWCPTLCDTNGLYSPWNSLGQNTGVGSLSLLQGIFPTQGLNPCLLHCRWILYLLSHKGSQVEAVDYNICFFFFFWLHFEICGISQIRDQTHAPASEAWSLNH